MPRKPLDPIPTSDEIYECYLEACEDMLRGSPNLTMQAVLPLCDLFHKIKSKFRGYKHERFHDMQEDFYLNWTNWNGYQVVLMRGHLGGVCTERKRDRDTIHPEIGWKFIEMKRV